MTDLDTDKQEVTYYLGDDGEEPSAETPDCLLKPEPMPIAEENHDENKERGNWGGKLDFLLSCLSYAVGLGNLWRFPYLCYSNGGGAFLIVFAIMLTLTGLPLFFMELAFGQYASAGVVSIWKVCPLFKGLGWSMFSVSFFVSLYYNMIIAWTFFYLFASLAKDVPWRTCDNHWNTQACQILGLAEEKNCTSINGTYYNHTCYTVEEHGTAEMAVIANLSITAKETAVGPSDEFFHNYILDLSSGWHEFGDIRWEPMLCLLLAWVIVGVCLINGIKSSGKAVYFTATFPYVVLVILLVRGATLPGCLDGIIYYLTPEWGRLLSAKVWGDAIVQVFFSLSPCFGGIITLASYNKFNNDCLRDSVVLTAINFATSIFAGFVIFGIIGFMAHELGLRVDQVARPGAGLAFIVYPQVVTKLPISPLWAILFFSMLLTLGIGTQFAIVNTVLTTILDEFSHVLRKGYRPKLVLLAVCVVCFLGGLLFCTRGGMYMVQLLDNYAASYSVLILGILESVVLAYVYGVDKFYDDIELMLGRYPSRWWKICWRFITPASILFVMIFTWIDFERSKYGDYTFPIYADVLGWMLTLTTLLPTPLVMIYKLYEYRDKGTIKQRILYLIKPSDEWGPALPEHRAKRRAQTAAIHESQVPLRCDSFAVDQSVQSSLNVAIIHKGGVTTSI